MRVVTDEHSVLQRRVSKALERSRGILGGFRGALAGILIGGGGTIAATEGNDVELPVGTVLRVRLDTPLTLR